jgi:murein L,D-transpeptidase YcbB/YkuD
VSPLTPALQARVQSASPQACAGPDDAGRHIAREFQRFYKQNGYRPVWSDGRRVGVQTAELIRSLRAADQEGLTPADYHPDQLDAIARGSLDENRAVELELQATCGYLTYAWHLTHGTSDPEDIDSHWRRAARDVDLPAALQNGLAENRIAASLARMAPASPQYQGLKHQLQRYRGMPRDASVDATIERIVLNMERWRWMPDALGARYILVNIPSYHLDVIEGGRSVLGMKVVVGKPASPTPVLADSMTSIVFSPYWNIPPNIARDETLPQVRKDPGYLDRNNIEIVRSGEGGGPVDASSVDWSSADAGALRFRQRPGKGNSLGEVKFVFPNHFNVYLHDTPADKLFDRIERDFSHGCVRLERPGDLARYVLRDQPEWTDDKIKAAMQAGTERSVALKEALPVYLTYFTAWEENGDIRIGDDVYKYDSKQRAPSAP